jgi:hypothetical protein
MGRKRGRGGESRSVAHEVMKCLGKIVRKDLNMPKNIEKRTEKNSGRRAGYILAYIAFHIQDTQTNGSIGLVYVVRCRKQKIVHHI